MSLFGAMDTAVSGLGAQSASFSNISDNVANSQTVGFKRTDTNFTDYLTTSTAAVNDSGAVVASPAYQTSIQGTIAQTQDPLNLAITGNGFFPVSEATATASATSNTPTFSTQPYYTRDGSFALDKNGYVVNASGSYLNGWSVNSTTGIVDRNSLAPIQVAQTVFDPVATSEVTLAANLPPSPAAASLPITSQISVYDTLGNAHTVDLNWTPVTNAGGTQVPDEWTVQISVPDMSSATGANPTDRGTADVAFGNASGTAAPEGTIGSITQDASSAQTITASSFTPGGTAALNFNVDFGPDAGSATSPTLQSISLNLGTFGGSSGLTQFAGSAYTLNSLTQNGVPPGAYAGVTTTSAGDIVVNYNNGQSRTIAQVPIVTFNNPDGLQKEDGQDYTATADSGTPSANAAGTNGSGGLVTSSVEQSNVDIANEFSQLIIAQQAYSANTKVVTTASDMLQQTIDMKR